METYLRLGLLIIAASIISLILFEAWYRKRQMDGRHDIKPGQRILDPDEILGLQPVDTVFEPEDVAAIPRLQKGEDKSTAFLMGEKSATKVLTPTLYNHEEPTKKPVAKSNINPYIIISVAAKPEAPFASYELLQAIAATGMRFGDMNIFHYQKLEAGGLVTLFSLASATEPGEFNLDNIGHFSCTGLTLFMDLQRVSDPQEAFDLMVKTAEQLAEDLDGTLRAGQRDPWTQQIREQYKERVLQYQLANLNYETS